MLVMTGWDAMVGVCDEDAHEDAAIALLRNELMIQIAKRMNRRKIRL